MLKEIMTAIRATLVLALLTGIIFPLLITVIAQLVFPEQSNGSLIKNDKNIIVGSQLIGQPFSKPEYFHPRPSAAGSGYDGAASGGTNLGPTSAKLILGSKDFDGIKQLADKYRQENNLAAHAKVPIDAVTRSGSGLDPDISISNALLQAPRVAKARNLPQDMVIDFVHRASQGRQLGFLGEPKVNVLMINLSLNKERPLKTSL